jgi:hypothetical protein
VPAILVFIALPASLWLCWSFFLLRRKRIGHRAA